MRIHKMFAVVAGLAVAMLGTGVARADGGDLDPRAKITVPTDPVIETCAQAEADNPGITCFETNSKSNPVDIAAPTLEQLESPGYDILSSFIYEPDDANCSPTNGCPNPVADALMSLWLAITPTIDGASYSCSLTQDFPPGVEPAFNGQCPETFSSSKGVQLFEITCDPTLSPCTGMLPGEMGTSEIAPEPSDLVLLGAGITLVGIVAWKRRRAIEVGRITQEDVAIC